MPSICHHVFEQITLPGGNQTCVPRCPIQYYTPEQYDALFITGTVFGLLAAITAFGAAIPHYAIPERRKWPHIVLPNLFSCIFVVGLRFLVPIAGYGFDWRRMICNPETHTYHTGSSNRWCALDAIMTYPTAIAAVLQWGVVDIYLTLRILRLYTGGSTNAKPGILSSTWQILIVYGSIIGYILITTVILIEKDLFSGVGEGGHCFLSQGKYLNGFWISPIITLDSVAVISSVIITVYIFCFSPNIRRALYFMRSQWRIIGFVLIFFAAASTIAVFWMVWNPRGKKVIESVGAWLQCSETNYIDFLLSGSTEDEANALADGICRPLLKVPSFAVAFWIGLVVPLACFTFTAFFLLQRDILRWWFNTLSCGGRYGNKVFGDHIMTTSSSGEVASNSRSPRGGNSRQPMVVVSSISRWDNVDD